MKINISNYKHKRLMTIIVCILLALFFVGLLYFMISSSAISSVKYRSESHTQAEINTYDDIYTIKVDTNNDRIYVFYQNAAVLNVYNQKGECQWAIAIPREEKGAPEFLYNGDTISIFWYDCYNYDAITGEYKNTIKDYNMDYDLVEAEYEKYIKEAEDLGYHYDFCDLWHNDKEYIINKPDRYILINPILGWMIGFGSGLLLGLIVLINRFKGIARFQINKAELFPLAKLFGILLKILFVAQIIYAIQLYIVPDLRYSIAIMGIAIAFIVLGIILANIFDSKRRIFNETEIAYIKKWSGICILGLAADLISLFILAILK